MSEAELSVVCKSCGAEVSPYVTECPYCGARLRKRAPELEHRDGGLEPKLSRRQRRRERRRQTRGHRRRTDTVERATAAGWSWATALMLGVPAIALLARIGIGWSPTDFGALTVPSQGEWWRFLTAPFVYDSIGYAFAVGLALVIFVPPIERRLGTVLSVLMLVACGVLGVLAAYGIGSARDTVAMISGGNGIALGAITAWFFLLRPEAHAAGERIDPTGIAVCAAVILLLPLVVDGASVWAGLAGGLVGALCGFAAGRARS